MSDLYANMCKLDYWTLRQSLDTVVTYHMMDKKYDSLAAYQANEVEHWEYVRDKILKAFHDDDNFVDVPVYGDYPKFEDGSPDLPPEDHIKNWLQFNLSKISPKKFINWCIENNIPVPPAFDAYAKGIDSGAGNVDVPDPGLSTADRKVLGELKLEKKKWDSSIVAAVKVGLLFYENGLDRPVSKDAFVTGFTEHLGNGLPDTTIDKIYKALPSGYKQVGGRPKKDATHKQVDIDTLIKAAVYAGSIYDTDDAKNVGKLKKSLSDEGYDVPDDDYLKVIVAAVKDT